MYKRKIADKKIQQGWEGFKQLCLALNQLPDPQEFFDLYLTPKERDDLANRFLIVQKLLENQLSQREMALELDVSIAKITRGSNELKSCSQALIEFINSNIKSKE